MAQSFMTVIGLIVLGYLLKRLNYIKESDGRVIAVLVMNVTLPSLIIVTLSGMKIDTSLLMLPVIMILYALFAKGIMIYLFMKYSNEIRGSVGMMASAFNIGIFAYPFVEQMFGPVGLLYFGMFDVGGAIVMFGITYFIGNYYSDGGDTFNFKYLITSILKAIPLLVYIIMLIFNLMSISLPDGVIEFFKVIAKANMPLSMIILGVFFNFKIDAHYLPIAVKYLCIHYGLGAIVGTICYFILPFNEMFRTTLLLGWLLPIGVAIVPYAIEFRYKTISLISMVTNLTIIISIVILYVYQMLMI
ncbi:AEC family transporter [Macrococcoides caseolyticum]|uniref:AEC family transporter n=1 Tax=Macrococcoides caseolyticum TaxID=69966 RepID=UPI001F3C68A5|nr:AEC family transporter [Macrococcus caseolyticus]MCE4956438.1 AEC family transporter [Macrococcus caseolyticus]